jgi:broad specificity phosphatase PhoE
MKTIWFIRHAESEANAGLATSNPVKICLTSKGFLQAQSVASTFTEPPSLLVTSPYIRTKDTAQPTIERFHEVNQEQWEVQEFTYIAPFRCLNMTSNQRKPLGEEFWDRLDPFYTDGEGSESFFCFMNRVQATLNKLKHREEKFIVIFTHSRFIQAILWILLGQDRKKYLEQMERFRNFSFSFEFPNASILEIVFTNDNKIKMSNFIISHLL